MHPRINRNNTQNLKNDLKFCAVGMAKKRVKISKYHKIKQEHLGIGFKRAMATPKPSFCVILQNKILKSKILTRPYQEHIFTSQYIC